MHPYFSQALAVEHIRDARKRAASARRAKEATASLLAVGGTPRIPRRPVRWLVRGAD